MNKRFLVLVVTGCAFATIFAAGCASRKRAAMSMAPIMISSESMVQTTTTIPSTTEATIQKIAATQEETTQTIRVVITEEPEETTATAKPTKKPTAKPTKKPTAKPTKKPTAKPTKKPTAKPTKKPTAKPAAKTASKKATDSVKTSNLTASKDNSNGITGIYNGAWSQITVDATNLNNVKLTVTIHDQDDSNKTSVWKMSGKYNTSNGTLTYSNCTKTNYKYDGNGDVDSKKVAYEKGQGKVVIKNGMITWNDYQEHAADDMTFISPKQHDHRG